MAVDIARRLDDDESVKEVVVVSTSMGKVGSVAKQHYLVRADNLPDDDYYYDKYNDRWIPPSGT